MDVPDPTLSVLSPFGNENLLSTNKTHHCKELIFPAILFRPGLPVAWRGSQERFSPPSDVIIIFFPQYPIIFAISCVIEMLNSHKDCFPIEPEKSALLLTSNVAKGH